MDFNLFDDYHDEEEYESEPQEIKYDSIIYHTTKATLFQQGNYRFWVPKSLYSFVEDAKNIIEIPDWFIPTMERHSDSPFD